MYYPFEGKHPVCAAAGKWGRQQVLYVLPNIILWKVIRTINIVMIKVLKTKLLFIVKSWFISLKTLVETNLEIEIEDLTQITSLSIDLCAIHFDYSTNYIAAAGKWGRQHVLNVLPNIIFWNVIGTMNILMINILKTKLSFRQ